MSVMLELQIASDAVDLPTEAEFQCWVDAALASRNASAELVIRIVDENESRTLNRDYRGKDQPTNVLSFPFEAPQEVPSDHIGDLVICAPVVSREAAEQEKSANAHWAHMVVHGILHLIGYDHQNDDQAKQMEGLEREILAHLGFPDPYEVKEN